MQVAGNLISYIPIFQRPTYFTHKRGVEGVGGWRVVVVVVCVCVCVCVGGGGGDKQFPHLYM